jgi:phosphoribosylformylglycinamidine synthase PurS subunit
MPSFRNPKNSRSKNHAILDGALLRASPPGCTSLSSALSHCPKCYTYPMKAHVWVMPKRTVLDPQGQTIQHALSGLGYASVKDVRQGKFFVLNVEGLTRDEALKQVEHISKEVLTNPVIEESRFEIVE